MVGKKKETRKADTYSLLFLRIIRTGVLLPLLLAHTVLAVLLCIVCLLGDVLAVGVAGAVGDCGLSVAAGGDEGGVDAHFEGVG